MEMHVIRETLNGMLSQAEDLANALRTLRDELDDDAVQVPRQGRWTRLMLAQTWDRVHELPGIRALFEMTASRPGQVVTATVLPAS